MVTQEVVSRSTIPSISRKRFIVQSPRKMVPLHQIGDDPGHICVLIDESLAVTSDYEERLDVFNTAWHRSVVHGWY